MPQVTPRIPEEARKGSRISAAINAEDEAAFRAAGLAVEEAMTPWLRRAVLLAARAGEKPAKWALEGGEKPRNKPLSIHLTEAQREDIVSAAKAAGVTESDYIRAIGRMRAKDLGAE